MGEAPEVDLHALLVRHLRRAGVTLSDVEHDSPWHRFVTSVDRAYRDFDRTHYLTERAADLSARELATVNKELARQRDRLATEMEVAEQLQTSILPRELGTPGFEIAALMRPATEVGGDYYDVLPFSGGCWIGVGDVSGHGHRSAVIMTMVQSMVAALVRERPTATPRELVVRLNECLHENVARRLAFRDFVTLSLLRCHDGGRVVFAGAHEDAVVYRAAIRKCQVIPTRGAWLGPNADVAEFTIDDELRLGPGDVLALYTDGAIEARNHDKEQYGLPRFIEGLRARRDQPLAEICAAAVEDAASWATHLEDDVTVLLVRARTDGALRRTWFAAT